VGSPPSTEQRRTDTAAIDTGAEEFSRLSAPSLAEPNGSQPHADADEALAVGDRQRALAVGGELLAEHVYPVADGRLVSQGRMARAWRRLQDGLDSAPERAERDVDMRLRALARRVLRRPSLIASLSPKGGTGKTTLAVLVAQLVSTRLRWPVLVLDTDFTGGTAREHIPSDGQTSATLVDALVAIRAGKVRGPADLLRHVCVIPGGAHLLAAPQDPAELRAIDVDAMRELVAALRVLYPVTIMDCAPGIGLRDSAQEFTQQVATDLLAVVLPRRVDALQARWTLGHLALQYPGVPLMVVVNQMPRRLDEGARCAQRVRVADRTVRRIQLPYDDALKRQLDAGVVDVNRVGQRTRIALKELVASLAEQWV
jgi:MinD-like ATPase involved in chromosome partitioning or flagellar assembly